VGKKRWAARSKHCPCLGIGNFKSARPCFVSQHRWAPQDICHFTSYHMQKWEKSVCTTSQSPLAGLSLLHIQISCQICKASSEQNGTGQNLFRVTQTPGNSTLRNWNRNNSLYGKHALQPRFQDLIPRTPARGYRAFGARVIDGHPEKKCLDLRLHLPTCIILIIRITMAKSSVSLFYSFTGI